MLKIRYIIFFPLVALCYSALCQQKIEKEFSYISDVALNVSGGHQTGAAWLGCLQASLLFNTEDLEMWKHGSVKFSYISTHGKSFSELTGDMQIVSNIEAGYLATTFELWYQHSINKLNMTIGLLDLNGFFCYSDLALSLINSSFGIQPTISGNMPVPIYPITALGAVFECQLTSNAGVKLGLFDGAPSLGMDYQLLPDLHLQPDDGLLFIMEFSNAHLLANRPGSIKAGYWIHSQNMPSHHAGEYATNYGLYGILEQNLFTHNNKSLHFWGKFGMAPRDCNIIRYFNGGGFSFINYSGKSENDVMALGFGQAILCDGYKKMLAVSGNETVLELTARKQFGILSIQPDMQYIINPSGRESLQNPFCLILRTVITI